MKALPSFLLLVSCLTISLSTCWASEGEAQEGWIELSSSGDFSSWREPRSGWTLAGDAKLSEKNQRRLSVGEGSGVLAVAEGREANDLYTRTEFQDVEVRLEYKLSRRSNSGVKLNGLYEIQFRDTFGQELDHGDQNGGVYPRADRARGYQHIDKGIPPLVDATRPAGEWQTLYLVFRSPRFDGEGKKTENARFKKVVLNGETIHEDVELKWPTGWAWNNKKEVARGPLQLQGDHGDVAFRNVAVRVLNDDVEAPVGE